MVLLPKLLFPTLGFYWLAVIIFLIRWRQRLNGTAKRLSKTVPRSVGQSCELQIRQRYFNLVVWALVLAFAPVYTALSYARIRAPATLWIVTILGALVTALGLLNAYRQIRAICRLNVELEGKLLVAQDLDDKLSVDSRMFHDLPTDEDYIDHVVIGPSGIFAIETRACSGLPGNLADADRSVTVEGNRLYCSDGRDFDGHRYLSDALQKAKWLQVWIAVEIKEFVTVRPVVVLPGWLIDRQRSGDVMVLNETELDQIVKGSRVLQPTLIQQIAQYLDLRNRSNVPFWKSKPRIAADGPGFER